MWTNEIVSRATRIAVPLLAIMALSELTMAIGLIPMTLFWGFDSLSGSAGSILSALLLVFMAHIIDTRASSGEPNKWLRLLAWLVTTVLIVMAISNFGSQYIVERVLLGTINTITAICCAIVASSSPGIMTTPMYEEIRSEIQQEEA